MSQSVAIFELEIDKNRLRPGLRPGPQCGNLQHSPSPLGGLQGTDGREGKEGERKGREKEAGSEGTRKGRREEGGKANPLCKSLARSWSQSCYI